MNTKNVAMLVNEVLKEIGVRFYCITGKRSLKWFRAYEFGGGGYSVAKSEVAASVACAGDYNPNRLENIVRLASENASLLVSANSAE